MTAKLTNNFTVIGIEQCLHILDNCIRLVTHKQCNFKTGLERFNPPIHWGRLETNLDDIRIQQQAFLFEIGRFKPPQILTIIQFSQLYIIVQLHIHHRTRIAILRDHHISKQVEYGHFRLLCIHAALLVRRTALTFVVGYRGKG